MTKETKDAVCAVIGFGLVTSSAVATTEITVGKWFEEKLDSPTMTNGKAVLLGAARGLLDAGVGTAAAVSTYYFSKVFHK